MIFEQLPDETRVILLLTSELNLTIESYMSPCGCLTPREYHQLVSILGNLGCKPADLLSPRGPSIIQECHEYFDAERLKKLLDRDVYLEALLYQWYSASIWILPIHDPAYPLQFKERLKEEAPPILYGCGSKRNLSRIGLAILGNSSVSSEGSELIQNVCRLSIQFDTVPVIGGMTSFDKLVVNNTSKRGGTACAILPGKLHITAFHASPDQKMVQGGRLTLISPCDPLSTATYDLRPEFRKYIFALSKAALIADAAFKRGNAWIGAAEQLKGHASVPIYVRSAGPSSKGLEELKALGAMPWPNPQNSAEFATLLFKEHHHPVQFA